MMTATTEEVAIALLDDVRRLCASCLHVAATLDDQVMRGIRGHPGAKQEVIRELHELRDSAPLAERPDWDDTAPQGELFRAFVRTAASKLRTLALSEDAGRLLLGLLLRHFPEERRVGDSDLLPRVPHAMFLRTNKSALLRDPRSDETCLDVINGTFVPVDYPREEVDRWIALCRLLGRAGAPAEGGRWWTDLLPAAGTMCLVLEAPTNSRLMIRVVPRLYLCWSIARVERPKRTRFLATPRLSGLLEFDEMSKWKHGEMDFHRSGLITSVRLVPQRSK